MTRQRLVNIALTLVTLVTIVGLYRLTPSQKDIQEPTAINGVVGKPVKAGRFDLTVEEVRVGKKLRIPGTAPDRDSLTSFVVVDATVTATREPIHLAYVRITDGDGVSYLGANRSGLDRADLTGVEFAPGIPVRGSFVIEMPADKLPGATLQVMEKKVMNDLEPRATVELGVEPDQVAGLTKDVATLTRATDS